MISSGITDSFKTSGALTSGTKDAKNALGKEAFMRLLVTQLQNQDPLNPMDDKEFTAQLAQFSSLEEMQNISKSIEAMTSAQTSSAKTNAVGFIGKEVTAVGGNVKIFGGNAAPVRYDLATDAASVDLKITNAAGQVVRLIQQGNVPAGSQSFAWDGRDTQGNRLPDGDYTVEVTAKDPNGGDVQAKTIMTGVVSSVKYELGQPYLVVGSLTVPLSDVKEVK